MRDDFSLERVFEMFRGAFPEDIRATVWICPCPSRGVIARLRNMIAASLHQAQVTHVTGDVYYTAILLRRRRTVLTIHDLVTLHRLSGIRRRIVAALWYRLPVRRAGMVTTISHVIRNEVLALTGCDPARVRVVYIAVGGGFRAVPRAFDAECPRILQIGTAWNKNMERQAAALAGIRCRVDYVGTPSPAYRALLERHGIPYTVHQRLSDEEIIRRYEECDMLLFASTYEGFGMPIVEANVVGRPVVTSQGIATAEIAGDAACLVDPYDPDSIRAGVVRVIEDARYREALVERGFVNALRFRPDVVAARMAEVYREVSARARAKGQA